MKRASCGNKQIAGRPTVGRKSQYTAHSCLLFLTLLAALFLRVYRLAEIPAGVDHDEAGNFILVQEIATGQSRPVFIRAYTGREAVFHWLAAAGIRLLGRNLFAFRLAATFCSVGTVLFAYLLAREMFRDEPALERQWIPLIGAALMAVSYWHVHIGRYGFRVNVLTLLLSAMMTVLWRGLRRGNWLELAVAGVLCGLAANTYLSVRAFPMVLLLFAAWVIITWKPKASLPAPSGLSPRAPGEVKGGWRWLRVRQFALFGLAALVAFAPLGLFFLKNPQYFSTRLGQVSIFAPGIHGGDLWGALRQVTIKTLGDFTVRGDDNPIYNSPGKPIFGPWLGAAFYAGLLICLWRAVRRPDHRTRTPYLLILVWLAVMILPSILGARDVPHHLRGMGMMPVVYYVPALGLVAGIRAVQWGYKRIKSPTLGIGLAHWIGGLLVIATLIVGGAQTGHHYFDVWARSPGAYYRGSAGLRLAAEYLSQWDADEVSLWVSNGTYRHATFAAFCSNYSSLHWFNDKTLVLPLESNRPALYSFDNTNPLDPVLARYIPADTLQHTEFGPDGNIGFEAYLVPAERMPLPQPQVPAQVNLGNVIAFIGYDLNDSPVSGNRLDVTLYWRVMRDADRDDFTFFAHLVDDLGFRWGGETFFHYPSLQWRVGQVMLFRKPIAIAPGAPPGQYTLDLGVFSPSLDARLPVLNETGQMVGTTIHVGPFDISRATALPSELPPIQQRLEVAFGQTLTLLGLDRDRGDLRPGETLALSLYWQSRAKMGDDYAVLLWLEGARERIPMWEGPPVHGQYPFDQWQAPEFVRDRYAIRLTTDAPAGDWDLRLALLHPDGTRLSTSAGAAWVSLGTIHVHATDRLWEPPAFVPPTGAPVGARLGDVVELLGYNLDRQEAQPGETIHLTLAWRCLREMDVAYTVFTHLLDENEQIRGQKDNPPMGGSYSTMLWVPGEVVVDEYDIAIRPDTPPGTHVIEVGMYDPTNLQRLSVLDPTGAVGDRILMGNVEIGK